MNSQIYSGRSSGFIRFSFFFISYCPLSWLSVGCILLFLNSIFWCCILQFLGHPVNYITHIFQFTSKLCFTSQLYPRVMFVLFKSVTTTSICSLCLLILISSSAYYVTCPFLVPSVLKTSNNLSMGSVLILSSFTSCLVILV